MLGVVLITVSPLDAMLDFLHLFRLLVVQLFSIGGISESEQHKALDVLDLSELVSVVVMGKKPFAGPESLGGSFSCAAAW